MTEIIEPATLAQYPPQTVAPNIIGTESLAPKLNEAERKAIEERLRGLGYIE